MQLSKLQIQAVHTVHNANCIAKCIIQILPEKTNKGSHDDYVQTFLYLLDVHAIT